MRTFGWYPDTHRSLPRKPFARRSVRLRNYTLASLIRRSFRRGSEKRSKGRIHRHSCGIFPTCRSKIYPGPVLSANSRGCLMKAVPGELEFSRTFDEFRHPEGFSAGVASRDREESFVHISKPATTRYRFPCLYIAGRSNYGGWLRGHVESYTGAPIRRLRSFSFAVSRNARFPSEWDLGNSDQHQEGKCRKIEN